RRGVEDDEASLAHGRLEQLGDLAGCRYDGRRLHFVPLPRCRAVNPACAGEGWQKKLKKLLRPERGVLTVAVDNLIRPSAGARRTRRSARDDGKTSNALIGLPWIACLVLCSSPAPVAPNRQAFSNPKVCAGANLQVGRVQDG